MMKMAVTGLHFAGHGRDIGTVGHVLRAQGPVWILDVHIVAVVIVFPAMTAGDDVHASVVDRGVVQRNPARAQIGGAHMVPVRVVTMPGEHGLVVVRRFENHLVLPNPHRAGQQVMCQATDRFISDKFREQIVSAKDVDDLHRGQITLVLQLNGRIATQMGREGDSFFQDVLNPHFQSANLVIVQNAGSGDVAVFLVVINLLRCEVQVSPSWKSRGRGDFVRSLTQKGCLINKLLRTSGRRHGCSGSLFAI